MSEEKKRSIDEIRTDINNEVLQAGDKTFLIRRLSKEIEAHYSRVDQLREELAEAQKNAGSTQQQ